jgi:hypothetical protein
MARRTVALLGGLLVIAALTGFGQRQPQRHPEQPDAARAVRALTEGRAGAVESIPADFPAVMGYRPAVVWVHGRAEPIHPKGGCSSPFGETRYDFGTACRQHDLGYDLLRYADRKGEPLGSWARRAVDDRFARQVHQRCQGLACRAAAAAYTSVLAMNSWRQGYGVPVAEAGSRWALAGLAGLLVTVLLSLRVGARQAPVAHAVRSLPTRAGASR